MKHIPKPIRIKPAFENREQIRAMFDRHGPYQAIASYAPDGLPEGGSEEGKRPVLPWFRGDWVLGGEPLAEGAELILHNKMFLQAAKAVFGTSFVYPEFVAVNVSGPMPAGAAHTDNPSFYGATRVEYPLPFLRVMGSSGLFDSWRITRASTVSWFYEGMGGSFEYWPDGIDGPMCSEQPPFGNVAVCGDFDRTFHRIGFVGQGKAELPEISAAAEIQPDNQGNWTVRENGQVRTVYPSRDIRFSILWKAEVRDGEYRPENLTLDRIMAIFTDDLRRRQVDFQVPSDPLCDTAWTLLLQRCYCR